MPSKRQNTTAGITRIMKKRRKKENPSLNLLLKRLDKKIDQRFDMLDRRIDGVDQKVGTVDQKVDAVRQETSAEFKTIRGEMAQGLNAVRSEMTQGFDLLRQEFKTELQKEFEKYGAKTYPMYTKLENRINALDEKFSPMITQLLTGMDPMARNYEQFTRDRDVIDAEHQDLKRNVETLKKRDMEKAAAIEKIEKEIDKLKAA